MDCKLQNQVQLIVSIIHYNISPGVALGKCVEYGYEFAADIAKRVGTPSSAKQSVSASQ